MKNIIHCKFCHHGYQGSDFFFTLCLHPCAHKCEWIAGQLATGARDGPAGHQHQNSRVSRVFGVVRQPRVLQSLRRRRKMNWTSVHQHKTKINLIQNELVYRACKLVNQAKCTLLWNMTKGAEHRPHKQRGLSQRRGWCPLSLERSPCRKPWFPPSSWSFWHNQTSLNTGPFSLGSV